jgi:cytochrome c553
MQGTERIAIRVCAMLLAGAVFLARAADPAMLANQGASGVPACNSCHGPGGSGQGVFPRLAGLNAAYLAKQLGDFSGGSRVNGVMQPIARALPPADQQALARYYAAMPATARPAAALAAEDAGAKLATRGQWSKGVPACVQCHGPGGVGIGDHFPALAGQPAGYIASQLKAWQAGTRKNDPIELMRHVAGQLSDSDIQAVSNWFAAQPVAATGGRP